MTSPMTPSHLTLSDLERSKSRSLRFRIVSTYCISIVSCKEVELGHTLPLNINIHTWGVHWCDYI